MKKIWIHKFIGEIFSIVGKIKRKKSRENPILKALTVTFVTSVTFVTLCNLN
ncbi:MAG: hypothetical protein PHQ96_04660 [Candidatus Omnitrophica bacterium]|nr:hypothetical protein [Candidatus Omnitrophota bacterium]